MQEVRRRRAFGIGLRARLPMVARYLALAVLVFGIIFVALSYYRLRNNRPFRLRASNPELSQQVERIVEGYEHKVNEAGRLRLLLRAGREITYTDGRHELEGVHLEVYPQTGEGKDQITSQRAAYDQESQRVAFAGKVQIETRDRLKAQTEAITYDQRTETAETIVPVEFQRDNVHGRADAATVDSKNKKLNLRGGVEITVEPDVNNEAAMRNAHRGRPVTIRAPRADFDQTALILSFSGGASAEQERDIMSGETLSAQLGEQKRVRHIAARGNSYLRTMEEGRAAEIHSAEMDFTFNADQKLERAESRRDVRARSLDSDAEMNLANANNVITEFSVQNEKSLLREMRADGRPVVTLGAPRSQANNPRAAGKRLTADNMKLMWRASGRDIERIEAAGNAELVVEPVQATPIADRKTLHAPRFDCEFYEAGNLARVFFATGGARAIFEPLQPSEQRATRTITSQNMSATFVRETQDVERLEAQLDARFNERDRNGQAANAVYTAADETIRLRGGEPVIWDSRARTKAAEIDSNSRARTSQARGRVTTTYYSQEGTNGATPFAKVKSPVFASGNEAEFDHDAKLAVYNGNARLWQDDNFVSADRIILRSEQRRMEGDGNVKSALYQVRRKEASGARTVVPVFASSDRMFYQDADRLLHYEGNVDIKQGTERITSAIADVFLLKDSYEVERTVAQRSVVVQQPGKRGTGDWAQYTAADETVVLAGNPARVEDAEQGTSESRRMTVYLRENRIVSNDGADGAKGTGRVRSTHRVRRGQQQ
ncbi:MAG: LPS export ABC transporter periplasmic protein LptC [Pyrinomonadaceae bacterium]